MIGNLVGVVIWRLSARLHCGDSSRRFLPGVPDFSDKRGVMPGMNQKDWVFKGGATEGPITRSNERRMMSYGFWRVGGLVMLVSLSSVTSSCSQDETSGSRGSGPSSSMSGGHTSSGGVGTASGGLSDGPTGGVLTGTGGDLFVTGGADGTGGNSGTGGETYVSMACADLTVPTLSVERIEAPTIALLGAPFETDEDDDGGPGDWSTNYGKSPEIIPHVDGDVLEVLFQDQSSSSFAYVVRVVPSQTGYRIEAAFRVASLGRIMGFTKDEAGNYYVATGVDEDDVVDAVYPPNKIHRPDIVRIVKFDIHGCVLMESDVDMARGAFNEGAEIIVNPMVAASSRLVYGGGRLLLTHGHNTEPDASINGTRHQKALTTILNATDGTVTRASTMWVSHSFDQRALYDGTGFVEMHLGDAFPRYVALGHYNDEGGEGAYAAYTIKGAEGDNNTFTRLGSVVQTSDPTYGILALFATERTPTDGGTGAIRGTRDVALVRVRNDFFEYDPDESIVEQSGATEHMVVSNGQDVVNYVRWLTDLGPDVHAERPRMTLIDGGDLIVLYERWIEAGDDYDGTYALRIDGKGALLAGPTEIPGDHHLSRGDDIVSLGGRAVYVTGGEGALHLNFVGTDLSAERIALP